jgi:hypothetical protein
VRARSVLVVLALTLCASLAGPSVASAQTTIPRKPAPTWFTPSLAAQVHQAGADGVQVAEEYLNTDCPGVATGFGAGACIVAPYGCTANFIFTDGTSQYIGTARHCVDKTGQTVVMQVDTTTLAEVGTVVKHTGGDGEPGNDFSLIRIDPAVAQKWGVNPAMPVVGGPQGVYDECAVGQPLDYYGHGYGVAVGQGKPEGGLAIQWFADGYNWEGVGAPGDSGSGVLAADGRAAGNFTHLIILSPPYQTGLAGMRMTAILKFLGPGYRLVNADGTTSGYDGTQCTTDGSTSSGGGKPPKKPSGGKGPKQA